MIVSFKQGQTFLFHFPDLLLIYIHGQPIYQALLSCQQHSKVGRLLNFNLPVIRLQLRWVTVCTWVHTKHLDNCRFKSKQTKLWIIWQLSQTTDTFQHSVHSRITSTSWMKLRTKQHVAAPTNQWRWASTPHAETANTIKFSAVKSFLLCSYLFPL